MNGPRFQFTLSRLLWATFWASATLAIWTFPWPETLGSVGWVVIMGLHLVCPVNTVTVFFGWPLMTVAWGFAVAAGVLFLLAGILMWAIAHGS